MKNTKGYWYFIFLFIHSSANIGLGLVVVCIDKTRAAMSNFLLDAYYLNRDSIFLFALSLSSDETKREKELTTEQL